MDRTSRIMAGFASLMTWPVSLAFLSASPQESGTLRTSGLAHKESRIEVLNDRRVPPSPDVSSLGSFRPVSYTIRQPLSLAPAHLPSPAASRAHEAQRGLSCGRRVHASRVSWGQMLMNVRASDIRLVK